MPATLATAYDMQSPKFRAAGWRPLPKRRKASVAAWKWSSEKGTIVAPIRRMETSSTERTWGPTRAVRTWRIRTAWGRRSGRHRPPGHAEKAAHIRVPPGAWRLEPSYPTPLARPRPAHIRGFRPLPPGSEYGLARQVARTAIPPAESTPAGSSSGLAFRPLPPTPPFL